MQAAPSTPPDELEPHEPRHRRRGDAGQGVRQHAREGHRGIGEARRRGEPVGGRDVGAHGEGHHRAPPGAHHPEDHEHEPEGGDRLGEEVRSRGPVMRRQRQRRQAEHGVGGDGAGGAAGELRQDIGHRGPGPKPPEEPVDQGDHGVEMGPRHGAHGEDDRHQGRCGGGGVLEQLEPHLVRRQALGGDPGPHHGGHQEGGAHELGQRLTRQRPVDQQHGAGVSASASTV